MSDIKEFYRRAANGEGQVYSVELKADEPRGVVQIVHGMSEHSGRYLDLARALNQHGYSVYANDLVGHGISQQGHKGAFSEEAGGYDCLVDDIESLFRFGEKRSGHCPKVLIGVGLGAALAELHCARYGSESLLMGIGQLANPTLAPAISTAATNHILVNGYTSVSMAVHNMMTDHARMPGSDPENQYYWLTSDDEEIKKYIDDPDCGFPLAASAYKEILEGNKELVKTIKRGEMKDIPIYLMSGSMDEAGGYTRATREIAKLMNSNGSSQVAVKFYRNGRHDILHDRCRDEVTQDICSWIDHNISVIK